MLMTIGQATTKAYKELYPETVTSKGLTILNHLKDIKVLHYTRIGNTKQYQLSYNKANLWYNIEDTFRVTTEGKIVVTTEYVNFIVDTIIPYMKTKGLLHNSNYTHSI